MMYFKILMVLISLALILSCDDVQNLNFADVESNPESALQRTSAAPQGLRADAPSGYADVGQNQESYANARLAKASAGMKKNPEMLIKTADISIEVNDYDLKIRKVYNLIYKFGAYISSENEVSIESQESNSLDIRVSAGDFQGLVDSLAGLADKLDYKKIDASDVGEEFVDMSSRLKTKKEVEKRYYDILSKAKTIEDILKVEDKLRIIREEIESVEGRLKYLGDRVAYSTIRLLIYQELEEKTDRTGPGFFSKLGTGLEKGWNGILIFIIALGHVWPLLIIIGIASFFIIRMIKKGKK